MHINPEPTAFLLRCWTKYTRHNPDFWKWNISSMLCHYVIVLFVSFMLWFDRLIQSTFSVRIIDGQANWAWPCSVFTQKQVSGPRTAKSQPIWIKFWTHLLLYGIHLWADLDRDRRVGGSRPNQNDYVFVILVTHPKSYIETTDRRDIGGKPSKWRWGRVL